MANHKSAEKRLRQTEKRNNRNRGNRTEARGLVKAARENTNAETVKAAISGVARAARKGAMPKARADRTISRLQKKLNASG